MERLPLPASWSRISLSLKVQASYAERDLKDGMEELGYESITGAFSQLFSSVSTELSAILSLSNFNRLS